MKKEIKELKQKIETLLYGEPWFGRSVTDLLSEVDPANVNIKPGGNGHSIIELLYHMIAWAEFTLKRLQKNTEHDEEATDWPRIEPGKHTWKKGIREFNVVHKKIIVILNKKDDHFLEEKVDFRNYNFRFLLNGMLDHTIYHLGQLAYINRYIA